MAQQTPMIPQQNLAEQPQLIVEGTPAATYEGVRAPARKTLKTSPRERLQRTSDWTVSNSEETYHIRGWGHPYFRINDKGHVEVLPDPTRHPIDLYEVVEQVGARGLELPLLIRFPNILEHRIRLINEAFQAAIEEYEYRGSYRGVFPIKVNQQRHLVEEVVHFGRPFRYGLEAGSKPELLIALAMMNDPDGFIICNGYKDEIFMETALVGSRFDKEVIVVLERAEELELILRASKKLGIRPSLGVRAKLSSKGMGRWSGSSGDRAKFGLATAELVNLIDELAALDMLDCLKLLHFHIGSQVSSILPIKNAIREAANLYVELAKMGAAMGYLDVGGGLAVDYDGSKTDFRGSKNYDLAEYAADVVHGIKEACDKAEVAEPIIVTEAGRAVAAYQSVLVFEAVGADIVRFGAPKEPPEDAHRVLDELYYTWKNIVPKNVQESFHDAMQAREEARSLFRYGYLPLRTLAIAERLFWHCCEKISDNLSRLKYVPEELQQLEETLSAIYYCNFSMFQSAPDVWAIQQLFPIMPIHRLEERPSERATLADLTCDSDGMIKNFIDPEEDKKVLEVHELRKGERYLMAMFLVGAYQEILGDMHNLFGDTNAVHVRLENSGYSVAHVIKGDAIDEVFRYVSYDPEDMVERVRQQAERALNQGRMDLSHVRTFMRHYERTLKSYTYLTAEE